MHFSGAASLPSDTTEFYSIEHTLYEEEGIDSREDIQELVPEEKKIVMNYPSYDRRELCGS
jgi:hypothetical protein